MGHRSTQQCVKDLAEHGRLIEVDEPIDPNLEMAEIQRRVYFSGGPAVLFKNVVGCKFQMASNLFASLDQARFIFRDTIENVKRAIELKIDPQAFFQKPFRYWKAPFTALNMRPKLVRSGKILSNQIQLSDLPQLKSWPDDGGAFVTLPQVFSQDVNRANLNHTNLGMYRVQLSGNEYQKDREIGLHYQIHRGIGVHHKTAMDAKKPFRVNIFVGGAPAMSVAAVMPLPEGMSELTFAGALSGHRIRMVRGELPFYSDADFCITGTIDPERQLPEGPFGDHLGYYSLQHPFPVLNVEKVYHRDGAVWPFTVVGRPPQEDTTFGQLIHEITDPIIPTVIPGIKAVHAVDASGVHPLLLAIGSERYMPYRNDNQPQELLTQANAVLGQGQMSLAKYLFIINEHDAPELDIHDIEKFMTHLLERIDWKRDIHFQTRTTIDTLDYSGDGFNEGSKVVFAARGEAKLELSTSVPSELTLPAGFSNPAVCMPGVIAIEGPAFDPNDRENRHIFALSKALAEQSFPDSLPLIVIVDDSNFTARTLNNFLWVVFTRSNPAADIHGISEFTIQKHWGCKSSLIIDARIKPHHAPPLVEDPAITKKS